MKKIILLNLLCIVSLTLSAQQATVDWSTTVGNMTPEIWSVNDYEILHPSESPARAQDPGFNEYMTMINPGIIRIHHADLMEKWTDASTRTWNIQKIKDGFAQASGYGNTPIMICINQWPSWLAPIDAPLPEDKKEEFKELCKQLVIIMNTEVQRPVAYYEIFNEKELNGNPYSNDWNSLYAFTKDVILKMKEADSSIKCGGTGFAWANYQWKDSFLSILGPYVDFISFHWYPSAPPGQSGSISDADLMKEYGEWTDNVMMSVKSLYPQMKVFLDEYNVCYSWDPYEIRHHNSMGAVWKAMVLKSKAIRGIDGVFVWHVKNNRYGLIKEDNSMTAAGTLYQWGLPYLSGQIHASKTYNQDALEILPITRTDGGKSILLMNKTSASITLTEGTSLLPPGSTVNSITLLDDNHWSGYSVSTDSLNSLSLPPYSLALIDISAGDSLNSIRLSRYNTGDNPHQFLFSGSWSDNAWSNITNDYFTVKFSGNKIALYGDLASHHGIAAVSIDGGAEVDVDFYSFYRKDDVLVWTSQGLSNGEHTLKVRVKGTKNPNSTDYYVATRDVTVTRSDTVSNLISNPGFEFGNADWSLWNSSIVNESSQSRSGAFTGKAFGANSWIYRTITGLYPNTKYILCAYGKNVIPGNTSYIYAKNYGGDLVYSESFSKSYFEAKTITFTTGPNNTSVEVGFTYTGQTGEAFVDDFILMPCATLPDSLIFNSAPATVSSSGGTSLVNISWNHPSAMILYVDIYNSSDVKIGGNYIWVGASGTSNIQITSDPTGTEPGYWKAFLLGENWTPLSTATSPLNFEDD